MSFTIRPAKASDLTGIAALEASCFPVHAYPPFFFRQAYDALGGFFLAAKDGDGDIAGYSLGAVDVRDNTGWVLSVAVRERDRRKGIGSGLMTALLDRLKAAGAERVKLTVEPDNDTAIAAYEKLGFRAVGTYRNYFGSEDGRTVMLKELQNPGQ